MTTNRNPRVDHAQPPTTNVTDARVVYDFDTFHEATFANFALVEQPLREPDFVSRSRSVYWDVGSGVIRCADHWGEVRRSFWLFAGCMTRDRLLTGYCAYTGFRPHRPSAR